MPDRDLAARRLLVVTEEELQRIVLDIHDGPVQNIFAALSQLEHVRGRLRQGAGAPEDCAGPLGRAIGLLEVSLNEIRGLMSTFRAPEFAQRDLAAIVEELAVQHETLTGASVTVDVAEPLPALSTLRKTALYRIIQEALSNIRRHAGVAEASIRLWASNGRVGAEIADRGRGFEPPPLVGPSATEREEHIGLRGMRERAVMVGGDIVVESRPGSGTRVRVEVPLDE
jgi:signal transduction histidine kinase